MKNELRPEIQKLRFKEYTRGGGALLRLGRFRFCVLRQRRSVRDNAKVAATPIGKFLEKDNNKRVMGYILHCSEEGGPQ